MKRIILVIAILSCIVLSYGVMAVNTPAKLPTKVPSNVPAKVPSHGNNAANSTVENITILKQDSGTNFTKMNVTLQVSPIISWAQAVEFKPPKPGWKLRGIFVMASDEWNSSSKKDPVPLPFTIDILNKDGGILYHYSDTQLGYFTRPQGAKEIKMATIEIPPLTVNDSFFVCFYGYAQIHLLTEVQNATGNSYYYDRSKGQLYHAFITTHNNKTIPVNWIIRAGGE